VTVAHEHDAKPIGFKKVYESFSPEFRFEERGRYHIFLSDTDDKAKSLRNQAMVNKRVRVLGMDIELYSAYIEFEKLDWIISGERVDELETERVSSYWLYAINIH
jgi:hypothetical protein